MIEALTTSCKPAPSANRAMISSGALPNVTLSRPPIPGPARAASSSVARPMRAAVGMIPSAATAKITVGDACTRSSTIAIGISGTSVYGMPLALRKKARLIPGVPGGELTAGFSVRSPLAEALGELVGRPGLLQALLVLRSRDPRGAGT